MTGTSEYDYDVVIAGAGPAGSSAAIRLATAGLSVLLVEQKIFPREKLCGEFISPECLIYFDELGVLSQMNSVGGIDIRETVFFARNGHGVSVQSNWFGNADSLALGLSRAEMDARLLERAGETGVEVREETDAAGLLFDDNKVTGIRLKEKYGSVSEVTARLTIDATGRTRSLARHVEKRAADRKRAEYVAFKTHLRGARIAPDVCEMYVYHGGYGGCSPVENNLFNLCFIVPASIARRLDSNPERVMREVVLSNKRADESLHAATVAGAWHAVPIERFGRGSLVPAQGLLTIGDAAAFIDPFTGSGILLALESSKIAAEAVVNGLIGNADLDSLAANYQRNYAAAFDSRLRVCSMLRHAAFVPFLAEATIAVLSRSRTLRRMIVRATRSASETKAKS